MGERELTIDESAPFSHDFQRQDAITIADYFSADDFPAARRRAT